MSTATVSAGAVDQAAEFASQVSDTVSAKAALLRDFAVKNAKMLAQSLKDTGEFTVEQLQRVLTMVPVKVYVAAGTGVVSTKSGYHGIVDLGARALRALGRAVRWTLGLATWTVDYVGILVGGTLSIVSEPAGTWVRDNVFFRTTSAFTSVIEGVAFQADDFLSFTALLFKSEIPTAVATWLSRAVFLGATLSVLWPAAATWLAGLPFFGGWVALGMAGTLVAFRSIGVAVGIASLVTLGSRMLLSIGWPEPREGRFTLVGWFTSASNAPKRAEAELVEFTSWKAQKEAAPAPVKVSTKRKPGKKAAKKVISTETEISVDGAQPQPAGEILDQAIAAAEEQEKSHKKAM